MNEGGFNLSLEARGGGGGAARDAGGDVPLGDTAAAEAAVRLFVPAGGCFAATRGFVAAAVDAHRTTCPLASHLFAPTLTPVVPRTTLLLSCTYAL